MPVVVLRRNDGLAFVHKGDQVHEAIQAHAVPVTKSHAPTTPLLGQDVPAPCSRSMITPRDSPLAVVHLSAPSDDISAHDAPWHRCPDNLAIFGAKLLIAAWPGPWFDPDADSCLSRYVIHVVGALQQSGSFPPPTLCSVLLLAWYYVLSWHDRLHPWGWSSSRQKIFVLALLMARKYLQDFRCDLGEWATLFCLHRGEIMDWERQGLLWIDYQLFVPWWRFDHWRRVAHHLSMASERYPGPWWVDSLRPWRPTVCDDATQMARYLGTIPLPPSAPTQWTPARVWIASPPASLRRAAPCDWCQFGDPEFLHNVRSSVHGPCPPSSCATTHPARKGEKGSRLMVWKTSTSRRTTTQLTRHGMGASKVAGANSDKAGALRLTRFRPILPRPPRTDAASVETR